MDGDINRTFTACPKRPNCLPAPRWSVTSHIRIYIALHLRHIAFTYIYIYITLHFHHSNSILYRVHLHLGTPFPSKTDEFSEKFQKGGGSFSIQKFILQNLDL